jgi:hypothetical protein
MANPRLDGTQTTRNVPFPPQVQRASLKKTGSRYAWDQNGTPEILATNPTRGTERHSLRRQSGIGPAMAAKASATPMKARKPSQDSVRTSYGRTSNGRQFTVGNIGNGGRIYLRYFYFVTFCVYPRIIRCAGCVVPPASQKDFAQTGMAANIFSNHIQTRSSTRTPTVTSPANPAAVCFPSRYSA